MSQYSTPKTESIYMDQQMFKKQIPCCLEGLGWGCGGGADGLSQCSFLPWARKPGTQPTDQIFHIILH